MTRKGQPDAEAVQPLGVETFPVEWSNLMGGDFSGQGVTARFALDAIPTGDFYIVVITEGDEARYGVQRKQRHLLR